MWGEGCVDKYISAATWPPQTKIPSSTSEKEGYNAKKGQAIRRKKHFHPKRNRKLSLRSFERSTVEIENSFCSTNTWELHIDLESQISQVL